MKWAVLCFIVVNLYTFCGGNRLGDFLHEKQEFLHKVDELFDTLYFKKPAHELLDSSASEKDTSDVYSQPLLSPEWPSAERPFGDGSEGIDEDVVWVPENYRPPRDGPGERRSLEGSGGLEFDAGSGGIAEDEESLEDLGSGVGASPELSVAQTTESVAREPTPSETIGVQCGLHLKAEVKSCVELSLSVWTLAVEMGHLVDHTGYYNVSNIEYLTPFLRVCMSSILTPPSCSREDGDDGVIEKVTPFIIAFANRKDGIFFEVHDPRNFNCFVTHIFFLKTCLSNNLGIRKLDDLIGTVILQDKTAGRDVCQDFREVQQCFVTSMEKCDDSTSKVLVKEMFEVTLSKVTSCWVESKHISDAMSVKPLWTVALSVISILTARLLQI